MAVSKLAVMEAYESARRRTPAPALTSAKGERRQCHAVDMPAKSGPESGRRHAVVVVESCGSIAAHIPRQSLGSYRSNVVPGLDLHSRRRTPGMGEPDWLLSIETAEPVGSDSSPQSQQRVYLWFLLWIAMRLKR